MALLGKPWPQRTERGRHAGCNPPGSAPAVLLAAALLVWLWPCSLYAQLPQTNKNQLMAAYLLNFPNFVEWPEAAFAASNARLTICVADGSSMVDTLQAAARDRTAAGRKVEIRRVGNSSDAQRCHVLFFEAESRLPYEWLRGLSGAPVLTVSDDESFARDGGIIQFVLQDNKLRFVINVPAANRAQLTISSKLLALAQIAANQTR